MKDLFGVEMPDNPHPGGRPPSNAAAIRAHERLMQFYGAPEGLKCRTCKFFIVKKFSKKYFKCEKFSVSGSASTDWRSHWQACGLHERKFPKP
jgi:hypothetical protein